MADSGIFNDRREIAHSDLFERYEEMDIDYGVMVDFFVDARRTLESAADAVRVFEAKQRSFHLVLVAQGESVDEYIDCYGRLRLLGNYPIAIGGLLRRKQNSARYIHVRQAQFLDDVLNAVRLAFRPSWLFALGVYHPKRHGLLEQHGVFGADYKGWIFNYTHKRDLVLAEVNRILEMEMETPALPERLKHLIVRRRAAAEECRTWRHHMQVRRAPSEEQIASAKSEYPRLLDRLERMDQELLSVILEYSEDSSARVQALREILIEPEQDLRIEGVHRYFDSEVRPRLSATCNDASEPSSNS